MGKRPAAGMTQDELMRLHEATLEILETVGVRLEHDGVVARLIKAGARPGAGAQEVRLPREFVSERVALAPRDIRLARVGGGGDVLAADSPSVFWTTPSMYVYDGRERREATSADLAAVARLADRLENVQGVMGMSMKDVAPRHRDFVGVRVIAENCRRHVRALVFTPEGMEALAEMKPVLPGDWLSIGFTAHGPLRWTALALSVFEKSAGHGIPVSINGEPIIGASGPVTLAGSMAVGNAEILAGIVVNQVLEPGRPVIYNLGLPRVFDMRHATAATAAPEVALFARASAELGRFYGIPSCSWASTESCFEDEQAALEKTFALHTHSINRASVVWGIGQLEASMTSSLAQMVIDDEMVSFCRRYERGFEVNGSTLALDVIKEVGIGGSYLETEHTLTNFREHLWDPQLLNRRTRENCAEPLAAAARRRAEELLAAEPEGRIGAAELAEIKKIEEAYRQRLS